MYIRVVTALQRERILTVSEEQRLAVFVDAVDQHCVLAPRGALLLTPRKTVERNSFFGGLSAEKGLLLSSYCHARPAVRMRNKSLLEVEEMSKALDFLDSVSDDTPHNAWALRHDVLTGCVTVRSVLYPGAIHYHIPEASDFGNVYFGRGLRDADFGFRCAAPSE